MTTAAVAVAVASLGLLSRPPAVSASPGAGPDLRPAPEVAWREVLDRAVAAAGTTGYVASMVVISLGEEGPGVTEAQVRRGPDGDMALGSAESWLIARHGASAMFRDDGAGRFVRLSQVQSLPFTLPEVGRTYDIAVVGRAQLATGPAVGVSFTRAGGLRERLFVDDDTSLVVRRETYDRTGDPVRVAAFTELEVTDVGLDDVTDSGDLALEPRTRIAPDQIQQMSGHGWRVPTTVGDGFDLRAGFAVDGEAAVQLVYSDGLYTLSVLEQPGQLDAGALAGAVRDERGGIPVYRWPGVEPVRMVWTGDEHTFTAVTDAPADVLMAAVADLPHDPATPLPTRIRRGFARLGGWLWPFG